jgi:hypothetical protein
MRGTAESRYALTVAILAVLLLAAVRSPTCCPVVEIRQYLLAPDKRDDLIHLFEAQFIETQEAAGIAVPGQFRVDGNPNQFDWMQGFSDMAARRRAFDAFYHGAAWHRYRGLVNDWLVDYGNVLLLKPAHAGSDFTGLPVSRPKIGSTALPAGVVVLTIYYLGSNAGEKFDRFFETRIRPVVQGHGARVRATFVSDRSPSDYPGLPVRTDANVFAWFACYPDEAAYDRFDRSLQADPRWWAVQANIALDGIYIPAEIHVLEPTPRSTLRCDDAR